ncbi:mitochondrial pyruvate carrier 4-like [Sitophilus oryzae]|uniref:Mitochondrial pyruvate carrier n=1 Tax=Sitophilus oryzae TaxID=7048 RepID=A0A6J2XJ02_SITOR|nr:mitochondrial pyruvate carrier 4-like [Sitophilus oryzae]
MMKITQRHFSKYHKQFMEYLDKKASIHLSDRSNRLWHHVAGPKTIFFWAPIVKWSIVIAGIADLNRPADQISLGQSSSLAITGLIWSRYSVVIYPVNYQLLSANVFMGITQFYQFLRCVHFNFILTPEEQERYIKENRKIE